MENYLDTLTHFKYIVNYVQWILLNE